MLKFYFSYRGLLMRLRNGALGAEMDRIAGYFFSLGYKRASAKLYLSRIARFSHFAAAHCGHLESYSPQIRNLEGSVRSRSREGAAGAYDATSLKPD